MKISLLTLARTYTNFGLTAIAKFEGKVQGVVVQMRNLSPDLIHWLPCVHTKVT
jgi:hypothetical protein